MLMCALVTAGFSGVVVDAVGYPVFFNGTALLGLPVLLLVWVSMRKMPLSA
jgi:PAT family beta-lactamase induction signal transducer AmpG